MNNLSNYILEKLSINKDTKVSKVRNEAEIRKESIIFANNWLKENTKCNYNHEDKDYDIHTKDDYLVVMIYSCDKKELEEIGDKLNHALQEEDLIYGYYELGSTNKTNSGKKLIFHLNIERVISDEDFNKTTFKRTRRKF